MTHSAARSTLKRTLATSLVLVLAFWVLAALFTDPAESAALLKTEALSSPSACRDVLQVCARPASDFFGAAIEALVSLHKLGLDLKEGLAPQESLPGFEAILAAILREPAGWGAQVCHWLAVRLQNVNVLVLLFVLRLCALKSVLPALAAFGAAAFLDAWCMRRIGAMTFDAPSPAVNFWLSQAAAVLAAVALGCAALPVQSAARFLFWSTALLLFAAAGWVRTFHRF